MELARETPSNKVLREHREERIVDYLNKHDGRNMDAELDVYPYGEPRPEISLEQAHHIAKVALTPLRLAA